MRNGSISIALAAVFCSACARQAAPSRQAVRVGVNDSPPYYFLGRDGACSGLAVDLINEAARRRGIGIRWVPLRNARADEVLAQNLIDIWPVIGITPARLRQIHITKPWFQNNFCLFSRRSEALATPADAAGRSVTYTNFPLTTEIAKRYLPKARLVPMSTTVSVIEAVCRGEADAGFLEARTLDAVLLDRPRVCEGVPMSIHFVRDAIAFAGIASRKEAAGVADSLYEEIMKMVSDGTYSDRLDKWSSFSAGEMRSLFAFQEIRQRSSYFVWGASTLFAITLAMGLLAIVAWRARDAAERAGNIEAVRSDVLRRLTAGDPIEQIFGVLAKAFETAHPPLGCAISTAGGIRSSAIASLPVLDAAGKRLGAVSIENRSDRRGRRSPGKEENEALKRTAALAAVVIGHRKLLDELEYEATHDRLTGLANRFSFNQRLKSLEQRRNSGETTAIFFIDLDRFKQINDGFGHRIGDLYLREAAERIRSCFAPPDLVARIGGDEFTAAARLPGAAAADICALILQRFGQPFVIEDFQIFGSVSIGASLFPQDGQTAADIQSNADSALYSAKELGRNQFQIYSPEMRSRSAKKTQTRQMIGLALDAGMFELFYQPQVNAQGDLTGMEALVRLLHPERGVIMPDDFVPVAEEAGLIGRIDAWVMAQACRQYAIWSRAGANPPRLAVNTSRTNLMKGDLAAQVAEALRNAALHPGALQIELTESAALTGGEGSLEILRRIRQLGVSLALDDFGTGYSSLSCLHQLPVDTVKIDKSFVQAMEVGARSAPLVEAAIAAAKALGMSVAAEGVERADQMLTLTRMGCDTFQGYYISKPLGVAAATQLLMEHAQRLRADAAD